MFYPSVMASVVMALFGIRHMFVLPFSGHVRVGHYETVMTRLSYYIYSMEDFSFPYGVIKGLAAPFHDANIGNLGAIAIPAMIAKGLGQVFQVDDPLEYFVLLELLSVFTTAYVAIRVVRRLGVDSGQYQFMTALLTGLSFLILIRSDAWQPWCLVSIPIFSVFLLWGLHVVGKSYNSIVKHGVMTLFFPVTMLFDAYAFMGIVLATGMLIVYEGWEVIRGGGENSWRRLTRATLYLGFGCISAIGMLYLIGMYPLPPISEVGNFTSYDFGMGGRYHVADLLALLIPISDISLLGRVGVPFTTAILGRGQYEGVAYVGTATLFILVWVLFFQSLSWVSRWRSDSVGGRHILTKNRLRLWSPWRKLGFSAVGLFLFSLGYQLTIAGQPFPEFSGMPAAWAADLMPRLYLFRAPGRWAALLSLFVIISTVAALYKFSRSNSVVKGSEGRIQMRHVCAWILSVGFAIHLFDVGPLLQPVAAQKAHPIEGVFDNQGIDQLQAIGHIGSIVIVAPSVYKAEAQWLREAYSTVYYLRLPSNLFYFARTNKKHKEIIDREIDVVLSGAWEKLSQQYGKELVIAVPVTLARSLREVVQDNYKEIVVGPMSLWTRKL